MKTQRNKEREAVCKYDPTRMCAIYNFHSCSNGGYCSHNPHRFEGKSITGGQIIFLVTRGYKREEVAHLSFEEAIDEINRVKKQAPDGTFRVWEKC